MISYQSEQSEDLALLHRILIILIATLASASAASAAPLNTSDLEALRARLAQCWTPPTGWTDPSEVRAVLLLSLNADGTLNGDPLVVESPQGSYSASAPESAVRAVRRCAPFSLPADSYDAWRQIRVTFDPRDQPASLTQEQLTLSGDSWWVAVASRQDLDEAIRLAGIYADEESRVVKAKNGWYAVVLGPFETSDISSFRISYKGPALPPDAMLTRGAGYVETMWPISPALPAPVAGEGASKYQADWVDCGKAGDPDASIRACSNIINGGTETSDNLFPRLRKARLRVRRREGRK